MTDEATRSTAPVFLALVAVAAALVLVSVAVCTLVSLTWFTLASAQALPGVVAASAAEAAAVGIALPPLVGRDAELAAHPYGLGGEDASCS